ncbi:MAG: TMEM175 family protein [Bacteroidota bacterium]|nr:TMEM175 family protein [Bacteroidota bacterium]MDP4232985.1 TMEM175 family protein [Bacteroidota bacterium]MDP4242029.1 TMEM175 family protein [Bacteroidota bacterium]MDP4286932.1 TMEM175 family protein [Bacteroidota bacterium]
MAQDSAPQQSAFLSPRLKVRVSVRRVIAVGVRTQTSHLIHTIMVRDTARVEAFSDGVFTIAMTLLVLEIEVPRGVLDNGQLIRNLLAEWPKFAAYLTSFSTIGMLWMSHHYLFKHIERSDNLLFYTNLLLLLLVTFVPFPTALLAEYLGSSGETTAAVLYAATFFAISLAFLLLWQHAAHKRRLISESVEQSVVRGVTRSYRSRPIFRFALLLLAFVNAYVSLILTFALAVLFAIPPKAWAKPRPVARKREH